MHYLRVDARFVALGSLLCLAALSMSVTSAQVLPPLDTEAVYRSRFWTEAQKIVRDLGTTHQQETDAGVDALAASPDAQPWRPTDRDLTGPVLPKGAVYSVDHSAQRPAASTMGYSSRPVPTGVVSAAVSSEDDGENADVSILAATAPTALSATCSGVGIPFTPPNDTVACVCPYDRIGRYCESYRPYTCNITQVYPPPSCVVDSGDERLQVDRACHREPLVPGTNLTFGFIVACNFTSMTNILSGTNYSAAATGGVNATAANFTYFAFRDRELNVTVGPNNTVTTTVLNYTRFAISTPVTVRLRLRFYNFWRLSERLFESTATLSGAQLSANETVNLTLSVPATGLPAAYYAGGRVYGDVAFVSVSPLRGLLRYRSAQVFLDPPDPLVYDRYTQPPPPFPWYIPTGVGVGVLVVVVVTIACVRMARAARGKRQQDTAIMEDVMRRLREIQTGSGSHSKTE